MFRLEKRIRFEASHQLKGHDGKCARLHGHSWQAVIVCEGPALVSQGPKRAMLVDYDDISAAVRPLIEDKLDHYHLNDTLQLERPTSEEIAMWIWAQLIGSKIGHVLKGVRVEETCTAAAEYRPDVFPNNG